VKIRLQVNCGSGWSDGEAATTGNSGESAFDVKLKPGCRFRCSSLGDAATQQWSGADHVYFRLTQRPGCQDDYDPFQDLWSGLPSASRFCYDRDFAHQGGAR
jgi:hypothetical protein